MKRVFRLKYQRKDGADWFWLHKADAAANTDNPQHPTAEQKEAHEFDRRKDAASFGGNLLAVTCRSVELIPGYAEEKTAEKATPQVAPDPPRLPAPVAPSDFDALSGADGQSLSEMLMWADTLANDEAVAIPQINEMPREMGYWLHYFAGRGLSAFRSALEKAEPREPTKMLLTYDDWRARGRQVSKGEVGTPNRYSMHVFRYEQTYALP